jgi:hypothetical protein
MDRRGSIRPDGSSCCGPLPSCALPGPGSRCCQWNCHLLLIATTQIKACSLLPQCFVELFAAQLIDGVVVWVIAWLQRLKLLRSGQCPFGRWLLPRVPMLLQTAWPIFYSDLASKVPASWPCSVARIPGLRCSCFLHRSRATEVEFTDLSHPHFGDVPAALLAEVVPA